MKIYRYTVIATDMYALDGSGKISKESVVVASLDYPHSVSVQELAGDIADTTPLIEGQDMNNVASWLDEAGPQVSIVLSIIQSEKQIWSGAGEELAKLCYDSEED